MSYVLISPDFVTAASQDVAGIGSVLSAANAQAAGSTTRVLAAGADEVSVALAAMLGDHALAYQSMSAEVAAFHDRFVQALGGGAASYAGTEAAAAINIADLF